MSLTIPCPHCGGDVPDGDHHLMVDCFNHLNQTIEEKEERITELETKKKELERDVKAQKEVNEALKRQLRKYQLADTSPASGRG